MFPYIDTSRWHAGAFQFYPFPALVAIAIATGYLIAGRRARRSGIGREHFAKLGLCVIGAAFLGGHLAAFVYRPAALRVISIQPLVLLDIFHGQSSFGAFLGGFLATLAFLWWHATPYRDWYVYLDAGCFAAPFAGCILRTGCYLVHDHPGIRTSSFLGVPYPSGTRFDLGLLEALFLIVLAALFLFLDRRPGPRGFFCTAFLFSYGLFRFLQDRLHVDPPQYHGFTVDQIASSLMIAAAAITIFDLIRLDRAGGKAIAASRLAID